MNNKNIDDELISSVREGKLEEVKKILQNSFDDISTSKFKEAINLAVTMSNQYNEKMPLTIDISAIKNKYGENYLSDKVNQYNNVVNEILTNINSKFTTDNLIPYFQDTILYKNKNIAKRILNEANEKIPHNILGSVLSQAASKGEEQKELAIEILEKYPNKISDEYLGRALVTSVSQNWEEMSIKSAKHLIERIGTEIDLNNKNNMSTSHKNLIAAFEHAAIHKGLSSLVNEVIKNGKHLIPEESINKAQTWAQKNKHFNVVKILNNSDVNAKTHYIENSSSRKINVSYENSSQIKMQK